MRTEQSDVYFKTAIREVDITEERAAMTGDYISSFNFKVEFTEGPLQGQTYTLPQALVMVVTSDGREELRKGRNWKPVFGIARK